MIKDNCLTLTLDEDDTDEEKSQNATKDEIDNYQEFQKTLKSQLARVANFSKKVVLRRCVITKYGCIEKGNLFFLFKFQFILTCSFKEIGKGKWLGLRLFSSILMLILHPSPLKEQWDVPITITLDILAQVLRVPNDGWYHPVKRKLPPLNCYSLILQIMKKFVNDRELDEYDRVDKKSMTLVHHLPFDMTQQMILHRKKWGTEANFIDLPIIELLSTRIPLIYLT